MPPPTKYSDRLPRTGAPRKRVVDETGAGSRQYTNDELEFLRAMQKFKEAGHPYPTWRQVMMIFTGLGYHKPGNCPPTIVEPDEPIVIVPDAP